MESDNLTFRMGRIAGILLIVFYCSGILISWFMYPGSYSPFTNWLSDLGNYGASPSGAVFYNASLILMGIAFFPFCLGLCKWLINVNEKRRKINLMFLPFGFLLAFSMIMAGVFSEDYGPAHSFWALMVFSFLGLFVLFSSGLLLAKKAGMAPVALFGFAVVAADILFGFVYNTHLMEWTTGLMSIIYVALTVWGMFRNGRHLSRD